MNYTEPLIKGGWLKTPVIIEAFEKIKREDFLPDDIKHLANLDGALPIGHNQTISQPLVVAFMIEHLMPKAGQKILDIGSGSGWTSALLAEIVSSEGKVVSLEIVPELSDFGRNNIAKYNFVKKGIIECVCKDGKHGFVKEAPFDNILVSAAIDKGETIPLAWKKQLKIGGRIVVPIGTSIFVFVKKNENEFETEEYPGFVFVPLISK